MKTLEEVRQGIKELLAAQPGDINIVALVDHILEYAYTSKTSDVHIDPTEHTVRLRFRVDGMLQDALEELVIPKSLHAEIISRIKVMCGLRTEEELAVRVSIAPTYHGENGVLRILAENQAFTLDSLGFASDQLEGIRKAIARPYGMILANGPTGSGKTTTLYTILKELNVPDRSIITIEDPIEYALDGVTQMQTNAQVGFTFASGLRSILRQDPNILMVGEIRDEETAGIAVNAALTGHLVLSTLHTNDAATTFPRLIDMGVPPFLVASTVNVAMGQRLVRTLCADCKVQKARDKKEQTAISEVLGSEVGKVDLSKLWSPEGCARCHQTGYRGRIGIREVLPMSPGIEKLILERASAADIKKQAVAEGMKTMMQDGVDKAVAGITSIEEVMRIIYE
jgi:type II secretory ATPase GspE/PulE/Tfp pilus assembly ATPase PilB-like protein